MSTAQTRGLDETFSLQVDADSTGATGIRNLKETETMRTRIQMREIHNFLSMSEDMLYLGSAGSLEAQ